MGSDQSKDGAAGGGSASTAKEEVESVDDGSSGRTGEYGDSGGADSPRPSICSDADLPYISYTVNRPIGDSPKRINKGAVKALKGAATGVSNKRFGVSSSRKFAKRLPKKAPQEVVVVREAASTSSLMDPQISRLKNIPTFLPIMRGALTAPSHRDPEVMERLDPSCLMGLCRRYQIHLNMAATLISSHQNEINSKVKEIDQTASSLVTSVTERQRTFAHHAERFQQVSEVSSLLTRCHIRLNLLLESLESLNEELPVEHRLEPFVWTTG